MCPHDCSANTHGKTNNSQRCVSNWKNPPRAARATAANGRQQHIRAAAEQHQQHAHAKMWKYAEKHTCLIICAEMRWCDYVCATHIQKTPATTSAGVVRRSERNISVICTPFRLSPPVLNLCLCKSADDGDDSDKQRRRPAWQALWAPLHTVQINAQPQKVEWKLKEAALAAVERVQCLVYSSGSRSELMARIVGCEENAFRLRVARSGRFEPFCLAKPFSAFDGKILAISVQCVRLRTHTDHADEHQ